MELATPEDIDIKAPSTGLAPASTNLMMRKTTLSGVLVDVDFSEYGSMRVNTIVKACKYGQFIIQHQDVQVDLWL